MLRSLLIYLSTAGWAQDLLLRFFLARRVARRFVAGETLAEAVTVIRDLNTCGVPVTVDHLGENVTTDSAAAQAAAAYLGLIDEIAANDLDAGISIKLTHLGLDLGQAVALANARQVGHRARERDIFVRIDMESTAYTDQTLEITHTLNVDEGLCNVGTVIQSYLYRSETDLQQLTATGTPVRLCKGAYNEPPDRAFPAKAAVDANYVTLARQLLDGLASRPDLYPAFATHDDKMISAVKDYAQQKDVSPDQFEFQMLYGIRRELQQQLLAEGYRLRIYVPYGTAWYPYLMRRLAERPANLWFFVSNLMRGG